MVLDLTNGLRIKQGLPSVGLISLDLWCEDFVTRVGRDRQAIEGRDFENRIPIDSEPPRNRLHRASRLQRQVLVGDDQNLIGVLPLRLRSAFRPSIESTAGGRIEPLVLPLVHARGRIPSSGYRAATAIRRPSG